jgi:hypothetical protein
MFGFLSMLTPRSAAQREPVYIDPTPIYMVSIRADRTGFDVEVIRCDGSSQTMRGFETVADAHARISHNKLLADAVYLGEPSSFQTSWRS